MGTTTFYLRHNDFGRHLDRMTKKELEKLSKISPYDKEPYYLGWRVPLELHNGNIYVLVFWKGKLMKLEDAPDELKNKYWDKYKGKTLNVYEWTLLRKLILNQIEYLDKKFKSLLRKERKEEDVEKESKKRKRSNKSMHPMRI